MNTVKVAILIPKDLLEVIDAIRLERGVSRSELIASLLWEKVREARNVYLKETYDRVFSDEEIRKEQLETARWSEAGQGDEGQEW